MRARGRASSGGGRAAGGGFSGADFSGGGRGFSGACRGGCCCVGAAGRAPVLVERRASGDVAREVDVRGLEGLGDGRRGLWQGARRPRGIQGALAAARLRLLPTGFPDSVSPDYSTWVLWHSGSIFLRDVLQVVSAQSLLVGLGLGLGGAPDAASGAAAVAAGPVAAATQWVLKDGAGSLGTLVVGSRGGQRFDDDPKRWWVVCSFLEDCALSLQLLAPLYPSSFLPIAAASAALRGGALVGRQSLVNGVMVQHFGIAENFGDVRAKLEALGRVLALVALPTGIGAFRWAAATGVQMADGGGGTDAGAAAATAAPGLLLYAAVFLSHNFCCYRAARALQLRSLNRTRLSILAAAYVRTGDVPSPVAVAAQEGVFHSRRDLRTSLLGVGLEEGEVRAPVELEAAAAALSGRGFFVTPTGVLLSSHADTEAVLEAALTSERLRLAKEQGNPPGEAAAWAAEHRDTFALDLGRSGWKVSFVSGACPRVDVEHRAAADE